MSGQIRTPWRLSTILSRRIWTPWRRSTTSQDKSALPEDNLQHVNTNPNSLKTVYNLSRQIHTPWRQSTTCQDKSTLPEDSLLLVKTNPHSLKTVYNLSRQIIDKRRLTFVKSVSNAALKSQSRLIESYWTISCNRK
jgi:hypothetical protein